MFERIREKFKLSFEYFWKYYGQWYMDMEIHDISKASKGTIME